jgi:hypothetical protein
VEKCNVIICNVIIVARLQELLVSPSHTCPIISPRLIHEGGAYIRNGLSVVSEYGGLINGRLLFDGGFIRWGFYSMGVLFDGGFIRWGFYSEVYG